MKAFNRNRWNTYSTTGYTHDAANDRLSAGGVHFHQVREARSGGFQIRILQSNGRYSAPGPVSEVDDTRGEAYIATAEQEW